MRKRLYDPLTVSEPLEKLREQIYEMEKELSIYGYDPHRGIESYSIAEIKKLISKSPNPLAFKESLKKLIEMQETLYRELYKLSGAEEISVDTDTPERRLRHIKSWLEGRNTIGQQPSKRIQFFTTLAEIVERCTTRKVCKEEILQALNKTYKRDYDRYRILVKLLSILDPNSTVNDLGTSIDKLVEKLLDILLSNRQVVHDLLGVRKHVNP